MDPTLRAMQPADWPAVAEIYAAGIAGGDATFESEVPPWSSWDAAHHETPRLVAVDREGVVGFAALAPVSTRPAYAGVAEVSVYVAERAQRRGLGRQLLSALVTASEARGFWTLQAGIFPENVASLALHEACGFRIVGTRARLGCQGGRWRDVVLLERRRADGRQDP